MDSKTLSSKWRQKFRPREILLLLRRFGLALKNSKYAELVGFSPSAEEAPADRRSRLEKINLMLTLALLVLVMLAWRGAPAALAELDQMRNDLTEQAQVIAMEQANRDFLENRSQDRSALEDNLSTVYSAIPQADEKAENVISMLEDMGLRSSIVFDSIGIRLLPETQLYYDDLIGVAEVYQYTFSAETTLSNLLGFLSSLRRSHRLVDIMTLDIEEGKDGLHKANVTLNAYHLVAS